MDTDLRNKFIVSVVDNDGIKQFSFHRIIKKFIFYVIFSLIASGIVVFFTIKILANELKELQGRRDDTIAKYVALHNQNDNLAQQVELRKEELDSINKKMVDLESIISIQDTISNQANEEEFKKDSLTKLHKEVFLKILPSGNPTTLQIDKNSQIKQGVLFNVPVGTPIYATADGIVDLTRNEDVLGIGKFVKIIHSFGFTSVYGYLSKSVVQRGDIVSKGQLIGYSGQHKNGNNFLYDIRFLGSKLDVESFIKWDLDSFDDIFKANSSVSWNGLLWSFYDIMEINNHKVFTDIYGKRVRDKND